MGTRKQNPAISRCTPLIVDMIGTKNVTCCDIIIIIGQSEREWRLVVCVYIKINICLATKKKGYYSVSNAAAVSSVGLLCVRLLTALLCYNVQKIAGLNFLPDGLGVSVCIYTS